LLLKKNWMIHEHNLSLVEYIMKSELQFLIKI
jgi:hypothetical protein